MIETASMSVRSPRVSKGDIDDYHSKLEPNLEFRLRCPP